MKIADDPTINLIASAAGDIEFQRIISALRSGANSADLEDDHPAQHFREKWHELSIVQLENEEHPLIIRNGKQIVIPRTARKSLLRELHRGHSGISKTYLMAKELYYWPSMKSDISNHVAACFACTEDLPAQPRQKLDEEKKPSDAGAPMEEIGVDYFKVLGTNWLVAVDRYSGYVWTAKIAKATTENTLTQLVTWFDEYGWPKKIRSDGGPQFRQAFSSFCKLHGISHELAFAYNPESNGLAPARQNSSGEGHSATGCHYPTAANTCTVKPPDPHEGTTCTLSRSRPGTSTQQATSRSSQGSRHCWQTAPPANGQRRSPS